MATLICADCGYIAIQRKTDNKYECADHVTGGPCKNNCLSTGTLESNELNGFA